MHLYPACRAILLACLVLLFAFQPGRADAAPPAGEQVEFAAWTRTLSGTLGSKQVEVRLSLVDTALSGSYCYLPCSDKTRNRLTLTGRLAKGAANLLERDAGSTKAAVTGRWRLVIGTDGASGDWTAPDARRTLPLRLRDTQVFPFEIRVVASALPAEGDDCGDPPHVSALRLYRDGRLVQELPTDSQDSCGIFLPAVVDANFDGHPDLTIAMTQPAGPDVPYQTWVFDPAARRFVDVPALQEITSPEFDAAHKTIVSYWRDGCCAHGLTTYRWQGMKPVQDDTAASSLLPVLDGRNKRYCYVMPEYRDGRIEFPDRVEQTGSRLTLSFSDFSECQSDAAFPPEPVIDIWQRAPDGVLRIARSERMQWKRMKTSAGMRYCPEVPFFAQGRIDRIVLADDPEHCSEEKP